MFAPEDNILLSQEINLLEQRSEASQTGLPVGTAYLSPSSVQNWLGDEVIISFSRGDIPRQRPCCTSAPPGGHVPRTDV